MTLTSILVFSIGALLYGLLVPSAWRGWVLLAASAIAIYWLQPSIPVRPMDFVLPTATLILAVVGWWLARPDGAGPISRENMLSAGLLALIVLVLAVVGGLLGLTVSPPPGALDVLLALAGLGVALITLAALIPDRQRALTFYIVLIVIIFVVLKSDALSLALSEWLRARTGRVLQLAQVSDVQWLGFSYVAFRLIHTLRDRQTGKLPPLTLREYVTYLIFFPAYTAGPIDRVERFAKDYRVLPGLTAGKTVEGGSRIMIGIFKKFVIADSLALFSLNASKAVEAQGGGGLWIMLYAYAFRLFFDFSGYSDIAIGLGRLFGINLPENFDRPYLKTNITAFWQSWHMSLSTWARFYVFTPLSRVLMNRPRKPSPSVVVLVTQVVTMVVIGLWHGITPNFVIWGLWHGLGLWIHKLYTDRTRVYYQSLNERPRLQFVVSWIERLATFHFVALGWVWFALPDTTLSLNVLRRLFGG